MSGGGPGLYRHGGASDSTNLDVIIGFDEQQLLVQLSHKNLIKRKGFILCHHSPVNANVLFCFNAFNSKMFSHLSTSCRTAPARHVTSGRAHAHAHAPPVRPRRAAPRLAMPCHATPTPSPSVRLGEASERACACGSPTSSYRLHKWCTYGPLFKSVEILLKSRYGIKQLIPKH